MTRQEKAANFGAALAGLKPEPLIGAGLGAGAGLLGAHLTRDKEEGKSNLGRYALGALGGAGLGGAAGLAYPGLKAKLMERRVPMPPQFGKWEEQLEASRQQIQNELQRVQGGVG